MKMNPTYHVSPRGTIICIVAPNRILWYDGREITVSGKLPAQFEEWREAAPREIEQVRDIFEPHV